MGYYSDFEIRVRPDQPKSATPMRYYPEPAVLEQLNEALKESFGHGMDFSQSIQALTVNWKWYDWLDDLRRLSLRWPNAVLEVTRWGEDDGDIERQFFHNGQVRGGKAEIVFPSNPFCG